MTVSSNRRPDIPHLEYPQRRRFIPGNRSERRPVSRCRGDGMAFNDDEFEQGRRHFLKCMAWVGTGAVWTLTGGSLKGSPLGRASGLGDAGALRFVQISDSHIGFDKPANTDVTATLRAAIAKIKAEPDPPAFILHTGDLTHLSKESEFD